MKREIITKNDTKTFYTCTFFRYGITLVITVASIMLSRLPEKIAVVLIGNSYEGNKSEHISVGVTSFNCGNIILQTQQASTNDIIYPSWNATTARSGDIFPSVIPHTADEQFEEFEFLGWAGQWLMRLPLFILSLINPWIYAYHNVDFKRCMNRYVRKLLVGWKLIGKEAKTNAGIFATVKLDRSYITTAQLAGSQAGKAVFCSLHYVSAAVTQGHQQNLNINVGRSGVCTCTGKQNNTLSPPSSPSPSSGYMKNIAFHMSSTRLNKIQSSLTR